MNMIESLLSRPESTTLEFKECRRKLNKNVYETVCAFLNRQGGTLLLGVNDSGTVTGIDLDAINQIKKDFITGQGIVADISCGSGIFLQEFIRRQLKHKDNNINPITPNNIIKEQHTAGLSA